ncbi:MAG: sulfatase-like hydrolase/transferase [Acidobacteria bacterium]|nr:sulfatase-like hydrolase/transferase [Acidobacteriota bacterium]
MSEISRRAFLSSAAAGALARTAAGEQQVRTGSRKPNLIFYMPETLRADHLGCYGHPLARTPNMDRLASQGVRFEQCHVQNTVCGPSRCSLLTGWPVHVRGHRSLYYFLHEDEPNLFRYLRQDGYDVFWFGKNDLLAPESFADSVTRFHPGGGGKPAPNPWPMSDPHYYSFLYGPGGDRTETGDYNCVQQAIQVLERSERPFCIYLPLAYAHPPFTAPRDFYNMYKPGDIPPLRPADLPRKPNFFEAIRRTRRLNELTDADFRRMQAIYLGMISYSDWLLGELLAAVDRTNHANDTAVFLFSDHGEWGGDYGLVEKWPSAIDECLDHVPLIVRAPGYKQGHVSREIVELFDVMATSLELTGIEAQHTHFARSLLPQLRGEPGDLKRAAFCEGGYNINERQLFEPDLPKEDAAQIYYPKQHLQNEHPETITRATGIRTPEYRLVHRPDGISELYDLKKDPRELNNVYPDRSYAAARESLHGQILDWYVRTADVAPKKRDPRGFPKIQGG